MRALRQCLRFAATLLVWLRTVADAGADPIPPGMYEGATSQTHGDKKCTIDEDQQLTLVVNADGSAKWKGFFRTKLVCQGQANTGACVTYADATIVPDGKNRWKMVSTQTGKATMPLESGDFVTWQCGATRVVLPDTATQPKGCVRLGRHHSRKDEEGNELFCRESKPILPDDTVITREANDLTVVRVPRAKDPRERTMKLARRPDVKPAEPVKDPTTNEKEPPKQPPKQSAKELSESDIELGMNSIASKVLACDKDDGARARARVRVTVATSGEVSAVVVQGRFANTPIAACVATAIKSISFPPWKGAPQSFERAYLLSAPSE